MTKTTHRPIKRFFSFFARFAFTALLLGFVVRSVDFEQIRDGWQHHLGSALVISFLLLLFALALSSFRWVIVSRLIGVDLKIGSASAIVFVGHFFNQLLPTSFGGDAIRGWCLWRLGTRLRQAFLSVFFDRLVGMSALLLLVVAGLPVLALRVGSAVPILLACLIVVGGALGLLAIFNLQRFPTSVKKLRFWPLVENFSDSLRRLIGAPLPSLVAITLSLAIHASALYTTAVLSDALGAPLGMLNALLIVPTVLVISALPVSIGGWGVREAGLAGGFALLGLPPAVAVTTSVLFGAVNVAGGILGGLVFVAMGSPRPPTAEISS